MEQRWTTACDRSGAWAHLASFGRLGRAEALAVVVAAVGIGCGTDVGRGPSVAPKAMTAAPGGSSAVAGAMKVELLSLRLPHPLAGASAATSGSTIFLFGGDTGSGLTDTITRFDAATGEVSVLDARLPEPIKITSAAFDGKRVYLFGGYTAAGLSDRVVAFDPATGIVEVLPAKLPSPRGRTAAFFDGRHAYVLGGNLGAFVPTGYVDEIVRFDPTTGVLDVLPERLPVPVGNRIGVVFDGKAAYMPGGMVAGGKTDAIVRYSAAAGVETMAARLPFHGDGGAFALLHGRVYILGGMTTEEFAIDRVLVYRPEVDSIEDAGVRLPAPCKGTATGIHGDSIYLFGGRDTGGVLDQIVRLTAAG